MSDQTPVREQEPSDRAIGSSWPLALALVGWCLIAWLGDIRYRPPSPLPADAGADQFSAERAMAIMRQVLEGEIPHPAGSAENDLVRERILELVREWGYQPQVHPTTNHLYRNPERETVALENILFRKRGKGGVEGAIALVAHYDSSPAGPGASDDGVGLSALLEIARMLADSPPLHRDILFIVTDGEEYGLLGMDRLVQEQPLAEEIEVAINLEARGTTGGSLMFETSRDNRWLIRHFSRTVKRPLSTSVFYEIYRFLPNDTDFTILKRAGIEGYNFAFIGDVQKYHTAEDSIENVDRGSLQHHGQNALALIRELADREDLGREPGQSVYFDVFGWLVISWPVGWSWGLVALAGLLLWMPWPGRSARNAVIWPSIMMCSVIPVAGGTMAAVVGYLLKLDPRLELSWPDHPLPMALSGWAAAVAVGAAIGKVWKADPARSITAIGIAWILLAGITSAGLPGASYLFLLPALACGVARWIACAGGVAGAAIIVAWGGGLCWIPLERLFYDALGFGNPILIGIRVGLAMTFLVPALVIARGWLERWVVFATVAFVGGVVWALVANG